MVELRLRVAAFGATNLVGSVTGRGPIAVGYPYPLWYPTQHHPPAPWSFMATAFFPSVHKTSHP
jgi:hypothetical protein